MNKGVTVTANTRQWEVWAGLYFAVPFPYIEGFCLHSSVSAVALQVVI